MRHDIATITNNSATRQFNFLKRNFFLLHCGLCVFFYKEWQYVKAIQTEMKVVAKWISMKRFFETLLFVGKKCKGVEMQGLFCKPTNHFLKYIKHWVISTTLKKWCFFEKFQNPSKMPLERILTIFFRTKQKIVAYATFWKMRHHLVFGSGILRITVSESENFFDMVDKNPKI